MPPKQEAIQNTNPMSISELLSDDQSGPETNQPQLQTPKPSAFYPAYPMPQQEMFPGFVQQMPFGYPMMQPAMIPGFFPHMQFGYPFGYPQSQPIMVSGFVPQMPFTYPQLQQAPAPNVMQVNIHNYPPQPQQAPQQPKIASQEISSERNWRWKKEPSLEKRNSPPSTAAQEVKKKQRNTVAVGELPKPPKFDPNDYTAVIFSYDSSSHIPQEQVTNYQANLQKPTEPSLKREKQPDAKKQPAKRQRISKRVNPREAAADTLLSLGIVRTFSGAPQTPSCEMPEPSENPPIDKNKYIVLEKPVAKIADEASSDVEEIVSLKKPTKRAIKRQDAFLGEQLDFSSRAKFSRSNARGGE